jgi:hypothetical protein
MKIQDTNGEQLIHAYRALFPGEIPGEPDDLGVLPVIAFAFDTWLDRLRAGDLEHQLALDQSHTARKTRSLLLLLELNEPGRSLDPIAELAPLLGLRRLTLRERIQQRADRLRRLGGMGQGPALQQ